MNEARYKDLLGTIDALKKKAQAINKDWLLVSCFLLDWFSEQTDDPDERHLLLTTLANEYRLHGLPDEAEKAFKRVASSYPDDPVSMLSLAGLKLYDLKDPKGALSCARTGLKRAIKAGNFVRHAYSTQARAARALGDYRLLERSLQLLLEYSPAVGSRDVKLESDLLNGVPKNAIREEIRTRYMESTRRA